MIAASMLCVLLAATPWRADAPQTHEIQLPRFRIEATDKGLGMANLLAAELEADRDTVAVKLGGDYPGITEVRLGAGPEELLRLESPGELPPRWAAGLAHPGENLILLDANGLRSPGGSGLVMHELAHLAIAQLGSSALPRWFQEGLAIRVAGESSPETALTLMRAARRPIPLADLERGFPESYGDVQLAYAESKDFVDHLFTLGGSAGIHNLLLAVHDGADFDTAFARNFGPREQVEAAWLKGLEVHYTWVPLLTGSTSFFSFVSLLCVYAWARVRRRQRTQMAEMALEEQAALAAERIRLAEESLGPTVAPEVPELVEPAPDSGPSKPTLH